MACSKYIVTGIFFLSLGGPSLFAKEECTIKGQSPEEFFSVPLKPVDNPNYQGQVLNNTYTLDFNHPTTYYSSRRQLVEVYKENTTPKCYAKLVRAYTKSLKKRESKLREEYAQNDCATLHGGAALGEKVIKQGEAASKGYVFGVYATPQENICGRMNFELYYLGPSSQVKSDVPVEADPVKSEKTVPGAPTVK